MKAIKMMVTSLLLTGLLPWTSAEENGAHPDIFDIRENGKTINLASLLSSNKVTIVDFHADWCQPCKSIAPFLITLASENPKLRLVQVDIVKFKSPVATQFKIESIPQMRVYLPDGTQIGKTTSSFGAVKMYTKKATRKL